MRHRLLRHLLIHYYLFFFLRGMAFFAGVLVPFFTEWGGLRLVHVQLIQSWFWLWIFLLDVPTGIFADTWGRKRLLILGAIGSVVAAIMYGSTHSLAIFLVAELGFAFGFACINGAQQALVYTILRLVKRETLAPHVFAQAQAWHLVAIGLSAPIGSWMAQHWGMNIPMLASSLPFACAALVATGFPETKSARAISKLVVIQTAWQFAKTNALYRALTIDLALVGIAGYFVIWLYQPLLSSLAVPMTMFGWYHVMLTGVQVMVLQTYTHQARWLGSRKNYLAASALLTGLGYLVVVAIRTPLVIGLFLLLSGGFGITRRRIGDAYLNDFLPEPQRATLQSGVSMASQFCLIILNPLIGYLADYSMSYALIIIGCLPFLAYFWSPIRSFSIESPA